MEEQKNEMALEAIQWIVSTLAENNEDAQKEASDGGADALFAHGRAEAYSEVMDIIQSRVEILGVNLETKKVG